MDFPVFGLADPHLGRSIEHSMDDYGGPWIGHPNILFKEWRKIVSSDALVLIPGDISLARKEDDILFDYQDLDTLPGQKILSPGNHDWTVWRSQAKAQQACSSFASLTAIKNDAIRVGDEEAGLVIAALKGALQPGDKFYDQDPFNERHFHRELKRLEGSLEKAHQLKQPKDKIILAIHYPPFQALCLPSDYTALIEEAEVGLCVYGHIHTAQEHAKAFQGQRNATTYALIAADYLKMKPRLLGQLTANGFSLSV